MRTVKAKPEHYVRAAKLLRRHGEFALAHAMGEADETKAVIRVALKRRCAGVMPRGNQGKEKAK